MGITLLSTPLMVRINCVYEFDDLLILSLLSSSIADCFSYSWSWFIAVNDIFEPLRSLLFSLLVVRLKFKIIGGPGNTAPWWPDCDTTKCNKRNSRRSVTCLDREAKSSISKLAHLHTLVFDFFRDRILVLDPFRDRFDLVLVGSSRESSLNALNCGFLAGFFKFS